MDLVDRLGAGLDGGAADHLQGPDGLHDAVAGLGPAVGATGQDGGRGGVGIDGVGLAVGPAGLAVRAVDVGHGHLVHPKEPGEFATVGTGPPSTPTASTSPCKRIHSRRRR